MALATHALSIFGDSGFSSECRFHCLKLIEETRSVALGLSCSLCWFGSYLELNLILLSVWDVWVFLQWPHHDRFFIFTNSLCCIPIGSIPSWHGSSSWDQYVCQKYQFHESYMGIYIYNQQLSQVPVLGWSQSRFITDADAGRFPIQGFDINQYHGNW